MAMHDPLPGVSRLTFDTGATETLQPAQTCDSHQNQPLGSRVCDNCIWKKVKCDLGRPTCSRCFERGYTCTYSSTRRRPGPPRGSRRGPRRPAQRSHVYDRGRQRRPTNGRPLNEEGSSAIETTSNSRSVTSTDSNPPTGSEASQDAASRSDHLIQLGILPEEQEHLLERFLEVLHDAVPIFSKARFLPSFKGSLYSSDLTLTILLITAKLTGFTFSSRDFDLESHIDVMLSSGSVQEDIYGESISLDQFRKACLLAFYEFHQFPGQHAWMRVGKLIRLAYWKGLDRLDRFGNFPPYSHSWGAVTQDDLEDWRLLWWFVYRIDSYANLSCGTPYLIDESLVNTALMCDERLDCQMGGQQTHLGTHQFLPSNPDDLWVLVTTITSGSQQASVSNLHIITTTVMRQVGRALQLHMIRPPEQTAKPLADLRRRLSTLRLSLPENYLNPMRNALLNETKSGHHERLVTVLHLLMAQLLISIMSCTLLDEGEEWLLSWQQVFETCQSIASISEQWNSTFSLSADPAVCFIIFTALIFVDVHKKFIGATDSTLHSNFKHCEIVLLLLLEQLARTWTLPKLLILSFKGFKESLVGPLTHPDIQSILSRFEAPLHPRWLQFLSSVQAGHDT